jgi:flavoprotein
LKFYFHVFQISLGLSDRLLSNAIGQHPHGLVPVLLEDDQDMEEGIQRQMGAYGNGISELNRTVLVYF